MTLLPEKNKHHEHGWTCQSYQQRAAKRADSCGISVRTQSTLVAMLFSSGERDYGIGEDKEK